MSKKDFKEALKNATTPEARLEKKRKHNSNTDAYTKKIFNEIIDKLILCLGTDPRSHNEWLQSAQIVRNHMDNQSQKIIELEGEIEKLKCIKDLDPDPIQSKNLDRLEQLSRIQSAINMVLRP
jgi:hypothetical protein